MQINEKEVVLFGLVATILGIVVFITACSFDLIAGHLAWQHQAGYGWKQIVVIVISGLFSMWGLSLFIKWHEYIKKIHKICP